VSKLPERLPHDICRCHDAACPERETCRRWTERETAHGWCGVHSQSMRLPGDDACGYRIPLLTKERP